MLKTLSQDGGVLCQCSQAIRVISYIMTGLVNSLQNKWTDVCNSGKIEKKFKYFKKYKI